MRMSCWEIGRKSTHFWSTFHALENDSRFPNHDYFEWNEIFGNLEEAQICEFLINWKTYFCLKQSWVTFFHSYNINCEIGSLEEAEIRNCTSKITTSSTTGYSKPCPEGRNESVTNETERGRGVNPRVHSAIPSPASSS